MELILECIYYPIQVINNLLFKDHQIWYKKYFNDPLAGGWRGVQKNKTQETISMLEKGTRSLHM